MRTLAWGSSAHRDFMEVTVRFPRNLGIIEMKLPLRVKFRSIHPSYMDVIHHLQLWTRRCSANV